MKRNPEEKRKAILDAALACLIEKGYHGATMDEICERAGVSKGAAYWYFKSKKEIFRDILALYAQERLNLLEDILKKEQDPQRFLNTLFRSARERMENSERVEAYRALLEYWAFAARDPEVKGWIEELYRKYKEKLTPLLERGIEEGVFKVQSPDQAFSLISLVLIGGGVIPLVNENVLGIRRNWEEIVKVLMTGLTGARGDT